MLLRSAVTVCAVVAGMLLPAPLQAQAPASQRELNGFLLGQHHSVLSKQFGDPWQQQMTEDYWVYLAYVVDEAHNAYMVFGFPSFDPDYIFSIQMAGDPGAAMHPFLGLRLGDSRSAVMDRLGPPSQVEPVPDLDLELLIYEERNYSVELDSGGRLASIKLLGYQGFPDSSAVSDLPSLTEVQEALSARDVDRMVSVISPDIEIFAGDTVYHLDGSARGELMDSSSAVSRHLYAGPGNLAEALSDPAVIESSDLAVRVHENAASGRFYMVWSFEADAAVEEIVFEGFAGEWRMWEVKFASARDEGGGSGEDDGGEAQ